MNKLKQLQKQYLSCRAEQERIEKLDNEIKVKVLKENEFYTEDGSRRILKPESDFRMDQIDFKIYCELCYREYLKVGLDVPDSNTTPDYKSFKNLQEAENKLLKFGIDFMLEKKNANKKDLAKVASHWKYREKMLDLLLKLELHTV